MNANHTELHATETLLQRGVPIYLRTPLLLRLLGIKKIKWVLTAPRGGSYLRMGAQYLKCQLSIDKLEEVSIENAMLFQVRYAKYIYRALACLYLATPIKTKLFMKPVAWLLKEALTVKESLTILQMVIIYGGSEDFMITTRYIRGVMITIPHLGQKTKRS